MEEEYNNIPNIEEQPRIDYNKIFKIKWWTIGFMFVIIFMAADLTHVFYHESTHAAIYDSYGVDYTYGWKMSWTGITFYVQTDDASRCDVVCQSLQLENEIFSYNQVYIFYGLWLIFFIYLAKHFFEDMTINMKQNNELVVIQ